MAANTGKAPRALSPVRLRAIALRVQGLDITAIAREVGRDRTTTSRWFTTDRLVIEELDRRVAEQYETELAQHANLRKKAMGVLRAPLMGETLGAALTILRLSPKQSGRALAEKDISSSTDPYDSAPGQVGDEDLRLAPSGARGHEPVAGARATSRCTAPLAGSGIRRRGGSSIGCSSWTTWRAPRYGARGGERRGHRRLLVGDRANSRRSSSTTRGGRSTRHGRSSAARGTTLTMTSRRGRGPIGPSG